MAVRSYSILGQINPLAGILTDGYIVPPSTETVVSTICIANRSAVLTTYRIACAKGGVADSPEQYIAYDVPIIGNSSTAFTIGPTLNAGDVIRVYATLATVSFNIFGAELT